MFEIKKEKDGAIMIGSMDVARNDLPEGLTVGKGVHFLLFPKNPESKMHFIEFPYAQLFNDGLLTDPKK
jgi:hypothetical protein